MTAVQARSPVVECRKKRTFNPRLAAEKYFKKQANGNQPRVLEDVSKESVEAAVANLLPPEPPAAPIISVDETPHQKVFRLVGERRFEEAARLAKRLIDSGDVEGFFIYGGTPAYRKGDIIISDKVKASRRGAFSEIINITPEIAQRILSRNPNNRKIVVRAGSGLAGKMRDILGERWRLNGQTIILSLDGDLNDGQHRLWAVVLTGTPIRATVFFGAERDSRLTVDTNDPRTGASRLTFLNIPNAALADAAVRLVFKIDHGREATDAERVDVYTADDAGYQTAIRAVGGQKKGTPRSALVAAAYILIRAGAPLGLVEGFFAEVRGVAGSVKQASAGVALREAIIAKVFKGGAAELAYTVLDLYARWRRGKRVKGFEIVATMPELVTF